MLPTPHGCRKRRRQRLEMIDRAGAFFVAVFAGDDGTAVSQRTVLNESTPKGEEQTDPE